MQLIMSLGCRFQNFLGIVLVSYGSHWSCKSRFLDQRWRFATRRVLWDVHCWFGQSYKIFFYWILRLTLASCNRLSECPTRDGPTSFVSRSDFHPFIETFLNFSNILYPSLRSYIFRVACWTLQCFSLLRLVHVSTTFSRSISILFLCMYQLCSAQCRHVATQAMWGRPDNRPAVRSRRGLMRYRKGAGRHVKNAFLDIRVGSFCSSSAGPLSGLLNVFLFERFSWSESMFFFPVGSTMIWPLFSVFVGAGSSSVFFFHQ